MEISILVVVYCTDRPGGSEHPELLTYSPMKVYLCKQSHWCAVTEKKLYYISELRMARHYAADDFPVAGETIQFLANKILGTAVGKESYHNGYAGHFVLHHT